ncbi:MAG: hypothetical protein M3Q03_07020 [Chloroflexota bacterium]|nr:hypothetical protein [Chloroflexota bacterium]
MPRVEVAVRPHGAQFDVEHAANPEGDLGVAVVRDRAVGGVDEVGGEQVAVGEHGRLQVGAARLLLPFEQHLDVDRERTRGFQPSPDRGDVAEVLGLRFTMEDRLCA